MSESPEEPGVVPHPDAPAAPAGGSRRQDGRGERVIFLSPDGPLIRRGDRLRNEGRSLDLTVEGWAMGGMGLVVWGPNAAIGGEWEALKVVRPDLASRPSARAAYEQEALVWRRLWTHPFIMEVISLQRLVDRRDLLLLQMKYAQHGSLRDTLNRARHPGKYLLSHVALAWAQQIASALEAMSAPDPEHDRLTPLAHCDLKPENVLIYGSDKRARISDLGLARMLAAVELPGPIQREVDAPLDETTPELGRSDADSGSLDAPSQVELTRSMRIEPAEIAPLLVESETTAQQVFGVAGPVVGTLPYMPPEQWRGLGAVTPATDIYAFGVLLFELFAGRAGFPHAPAHIPSGTAPAWRRAWYEAHMAGPVRRLNTGDDRLAALSRGPLSGLRQMRQRLSLPPLDPDELQARENAALDALDALIMRCLAKDPAARPTATQAREALGAIATSLDLTPLDPALVAAAYPHTNELEANYWNNLGATYDYLGRHDEGMACKYKSLRLMPERGVFWFNFAGALSKRKQYEEALRALDEADARGVIERQTQPPSHWNQDDGLVALQRGLILRELRRYGEAVAAFESSLLLQPDRANIWYSMALTYVLWSQEAHAASERDAELERLRRANQAITEAIARRSSMSPADYSKLQRLIATKLEETEQMSGKYTKIAYDPSV